MPRSPKTAALFTFALLVGTLLGASPRARLAHGDTLSDGLDPAALRMGAASQPAPDPTRKMPGDPCTKSDECQRHHSCVKVGDKQICQAPPRPQLPPGAVT